MKNILITGTSGQVGHALRTALSERGNILAPDRASFDLSNPASLKVALDELQPDLIINPAAYTAVDRAEIESGLAYCVNAQAPDAIARWASQNSVPLVHFSTDYVFDGSGTKPWTEDDECHPLSVYGSSKLAGENAIRAAGGSHLIIRTSWIYSTTGKNFFLTMLDLASQQPELRVVADQIGAPTSARSIANAVVQLIPEDFYKITAAFAAAKGLVHFSNSGETSWHGFVEAIIAGAKRRNIPVRTNRVVAITTNDYPTPARRPANSRLDTTRIRSFWRVQCSDWITALSLELDAFAHRARPG